MYNEDLEKQEEKEEKKDENRRRYFVFVLLFLIVLFVATFGITVSYYKGTPGNDNTIITDKIVFTYSDVNQGGSGIAIYNAVPITDVQGKNQTGINKVFDFSITATSKKRDIEYKLLVRKDQTSTLSNSNLKIYLTSIYGGYEEPLVLTTFDQLKKETINDIEYYVLYTKKLNKGIENYSDGYRLRMWVKENATNYNNKRFALKVDVTAVQVGD